MSKGEAGKASGVATKEVLMPTLTITTRKTKDGPRYHVRYRLGGRAWPIQHAGSFRTLR